MFQTFLPGEKRKMPTNRVAIGPFRAIFCAQKAMFLGYMLDPVWGSKGPEKGPKQPRNYFTENIRIISADPLCEGATACGVVARSLPHCHAVTPPHLPGRPLTTHPRGGGVPEGRRGSRWSRSEAGVVLGLLAARRGRLGDAAPLYVLRVCSKHFQNLF